MFCRFELVTPFIYTTNVPLFSLFSWMVHYSYIRMSINLLKSGNIMKKLSIAAVDAFVRSHFSILPNKSEPYPNPVSGKSVSYGICGILWYLWYQAFIDTEVIRRHKSWNSYSKCQIRVLPCINNYCHYWCYLQYEGY